jgi:O-antigen ligase
VLGGASAGALGAWFAFAGITALAVKSRSIVVRRATVAGALLAIVTVGVLAVRGRDFDDFLRFLGIKVQNRASAQEVQTYTQRTILAYIGGRIFLAHPFVGAGWQGSSQPKIYLPFVADARRKFPDKPALDFPAPGRPWGVQNGWIQSAADLGVVGLLLFAGLFAAGCVVAWRRRLPIALGLVLLAAGMWLAEGLFAGIPLDALTWIGLGLTAAAHD